MKTKTEICVQIRNEEELQQAKDMLEKNGEKVTKDGTFCITESSEELNYLQNYIFTDEWHLGRKQNLTEIHLSELESVLKGESESENAYYSFFKFMSDEHNLTLTDTEMSDIIYEAKKVIQKLNND